MKNDINSYKLEYIDDDGNRQYKLIHCTEKEVEKQVKEILKTHRIKKKGKFFVAKDSKFPISDLERLFEFKPKKLDFSIKMILGNIET